MSHGAYVRATWVTDIHLNFPGAKVLEEFRAAIAHERPDVLFVTGDIAEAESFEEHLRALARIAPVYYVLGNHDYYRSSIERVRASITVPTWMQTSEPIALGSSIVVGVDGWGDARCGDLTSSVFLSDWLLIDELRIHDVEQRIARLRALGEEEARTLRSILARVPACERLVVLTHVPPFAEACWHQGNMSAPDWLPWFTCIATGEVLAQWARAHPKTNITVLCGHTHGGGTYQALENLVVHTGGAEYGEPRVERTLEI